eukprot:CAMPEP_0180351618 /NCGR_PEP_ID=MMETSP0989-20121125/6614_1 /TAXON_ID=697907 /ORGANISM="non described non described, Strain CCMP2293" /LENGTH=51 /DNA_ID=CAMNT_0022341051 /DNA_START=192 /DNA_END=347 /DNA_ORIENTATION=-
MANRKSEICHTTAIAEATRSSVVSTSTRRNPSGSRIFPVTGPQRPHGRVLR